MQLKPWHKVTGGGALAIAVALGGYFEGERLTAYRDVGGKPTLCDGETHGVFMGMTATHAQCQQWLSTGMQQELDFVNHNLLHVQPDTRQAALADFTYNEGEQRFLDSSIRRKINLGDIKGGCDALKLYDLAAGKVQQGLINRRAAEFELCMEGVQ